MSACASGKASDAVATLWCKMLPRPLLHFALAAKHRLLVQTATAAPVAAWDGPAPVGVGDPWRRRHAAIVLGVTGCLALIAACGYLASSQAARPRASVARVASFLQIPSLPLLPPKPRRCPR